MCSGSTAPCRFTGVSVSLVSSTSDRVSLSELSTCSEPFTSNRCASPGTSVRTAAFGSSRLSRTTPSKVVPTKTMPPGRVTIGTDVSRGAGDVVGKAPSAALPHEQ